jgi:glutaredoxin
MCRYTDRPNSRLLSAMTHIKVFSTSWCSFCRAEKAYLDAHGVKYEAIDVETDHAAADEMIHLSGQTGVPFTVITQPNGTRLGILGFDRPRLESALGLGE